MFGIKIKGRFLQLKQGKLSVKMQNPLYLGDNMDVIPGSVLINTEVTNNDFNATLLENADDLQVKKGFIKNEYCEIWHYGSILFLGTLDVIRATDKVFVIRAALNTISVLKEMMLSELNMGTLNVVNIPPQYYLSTLTNPLAHPYIFHPVWNYGFNDKSKPDFLADEFQNFYTNTGGVLGLGDVIQTQGSVITPFFKLNHVLKKIFENIGFSLFNGFQTERELQLITIYNNAAIHTRAGFFNATALPLNKFLPAKKASDFLKNNLRFFGLGLFYNLFDKQTDILKFDDVLNGQLVHDWSRKAIVGHEREQFYNTPANLSFKKNDKSLVPTDLDNIPRFPISDLDSNSDPTGLYVDYNTQKALYHLQLSDGTTPSAINPVIRIDLNDKINTGGEKADFENELVPLQTARTFFDGIGAKSAYMPSTKVKGFYCDEDRIACEPYLMLYRGYRENGNGFIHPYAAHEFDLPFGEANKTGWNVPSVSSNILWTPTDLNYTLNLKGEKGVYNRFLRNNIAFINRNDVVKKRFTLDIQSLRNFSFKDKISVHNQIYLAKEINLEFDAHSEDIRAEVELLSIV